LVKVKNYPDHRDVFVDLNNYNKATEVYDIRFSLQRNDEKLLPEDRNFSLVLFCKDHLALIEREVGYQSILVM